MHGWATLETERCASCAIYTPTSDLVFGPDGQRYCLPCGVPPASAAMPWTLADDDWVRPTRDALGRSARIVAALMLLATIAFPLAACVSQL